jgi:hypothetical protein
MNCGIIRYCYVLPMNLASHRVLSSCSATNTIVTVMGNTHGVAFS